MSQQTKPDDLVKVADIDVSAVTPERSGFTLEGRGADRSDYRLGLEMEVPLDQRTRSVLGEMLSQCRIRVWRKPASRLTPFVRAQPVADPAPNATS